MDDGRGQSIQMNIKLENGVLTVKMDVFVKTSKLAIQIIE